MHAFKHWKGSYVAAMEHTDSRFAYSFFPLILVLAISLDILFRKYFDLSKNQQDIMGAVVIVLGMILLEVWNKYAPYYGKDVDVNMEIREVRKRQWALWIAVISNFAFLVLFVVIISKIARSFR